MSFWRKSVLTHIHTYYIRCYFAHKTRGAHVIVMYCGVRCVNRARLAALYNYYMIGARSCCAHLAAKRAVIVEVYNWCGVCSYYTALCVRQLRGHTPPRLDCAKSGGASRIYIYHRSTLRNIFQIPSYVIITLRKFPPKIDVNIGI